MVKARSTDFEGLLLLSLVLPILRTLSSCANLCTGWQQKCTHLAVDAAAKVFVAFKN